MPGTQFQGLLLLEAPPPNDYNDTQLSTVCAVQPADCPQRGRP